MSAALLAAGALPGGKTGDQAKSFVLIAVTVAVLVIVFVVISKTFGGINAFLEAVGLKETEDEKKQRELLEGNIQGSLDDSSPWSPRFYKSAPGAATLVTKATADANAKKIWDSVGAVYDDPEAGLAAIKNMPTQAAVSFLADRFESLYNRDLLGWLQIKYDTSHQKEVLNQMFKYVSNLPKYKR